MSESRTKKRMICCTTTLALAACLIVVPGAVARQPDPGEANQSRPTDFIRGSLASVESPNLTPPGPAARPTGIAPLDTRYLAYSYAAPPYGYGQYAGGTGGNENSAGGSAWAREVMLNASGVPNRNGKVAWPLGLRLLRGADSLRQQVEAQLELAVEQVTAGGANPLLLDEFRLNVEELRKLLRADREWRFSLRRAEYEEADFFLQKLKRTPRILAASPPTGGSGGTAP